MRSGQMCPQRVRQNIADISEDELLLKDHQLRTLEKTSGRNHRSVFHWIWGQKPLDVGEYDFIFHKNDFVSVAGENQRKDVVDNLVEACLDRWSSSSFQVRVVYVERAASTLPDKTQRILRSHSHHQRTSEGDVHFFSEKSIALAAKLIAVIIACAILLVPVLILSLKSLSEKAAAIMVLVFVLTFAVVMSLFSKAKLESLFIGTCA
jgi:hypothetical protein